MKFRIVSVPTINAVVLSGATADFAQFIADVYARTTDPNVAGLPWNNAGHWVFSTGLIAFSPSLDFSDARNSQYIPLIFQDI